LKSAFRSAGIPSISAMIVTGTGMARSATTSNGSPRRSGATHCSTSARTRGSHDAICRGVKPRFTIARIDEWRSPSSAIRLRAVKNSNGFRRTFVTIFHRKRTNSSVIGGHLLAATRHDHREHRARREDVGRLEHVHHVVETRHRPHPPRFVVVNGRLVAQAAVDRIRIVHRRERVEFDR
jgi:hypothetical protein